MTGQPRKKVKRPPLKSQRRSAKPGQIMEFCELPDTTTYWHLREKAVFRKVGNSHSLDSGGRDAIHGLHDPCKVVPETWITELPK